MNAEEDEFLLDVSSGFGERCYEGREEISLRGLIKELQALEKGPLVGWPELYFKTRGICLDLYGRRLITDVDVKFEPAPGCKVRTCREDGYYE